MGRLGRKPLEEDTAGTFTTGLSRPGKISVTGFCQDFTWTTHPQNIATNGSFTLNAAATGATSYQWFERINGVDTQLDGRTDPTLAMTVRATRAFFVRAKSGACSSDSELATVTHSPCTADATITPSSPQVDPGQQFTANVADAGAGAMYTWTVTNGTFTGQGTRSIEVTAACTGSVTFTVSVSACGTTTASELVVPIIRPAIIVTSRPQTMPVKSSGTAAISAITGAVYAWSITNGQITSATNQASVAFTSDCDTVELTITATVGCDSDTETISIPVTGAPTASIIATNLSIAQGDAATIHLTLTGTSPWTVAWSDNVQTTTTASSRTVTPTRTKRYTITQVTDANCAEAADDTILVRVIPPPPVNVMATAIGATSVNISWAYTGAVADKYRVERRAAGGIYGMIAETTALSHADTSVVGNTAYQYRVRAITESTDATEISLPSNADIATTIAFTDDPLVASTDIVMGTEMKAAHLTELRTAVNALRTLAGLPATTFTNATLAGAVAMAAHIIELRTAINQARTDSDISLSSITYTDPSLAAGDPIRAVHVQELRGGVR